MLDIIKNNINYHYGLVYVIDATSYITKAAQTGNPASTFKVAEKVLNRQIQKVADTIQRIP